MYGKTKKQLHENIQNAPPRPCSVKLLLGVYELLFHLCTCVRVYFQHIPDFFYFAFPMTCELRVENQEAEHTFRCCEKRMKSQARLKAGILV